MFTDHFDFVSLVSPPSHQGSSPLHLDSSLIPCQAPITTSCSRLSSVWIKPRVKLAQGYIPQSTKPRRKQGQVDRQKSVKGRGKKDRKDKTYSSWDSHVVTHRSTNQPVNCLCMAERTGCPVFSCLWPYVVVQPTFTVYNIYLDVEGAEARQLVLSSSLLATCLTVFPYLSGVKGPSGRAFSIRRWARLSRSGSTPISFSTRVWTYVNLE